MAKNNGSNDNYIPQGIVLEILSKMSVKPLIRFKSVCKSWKNIIRDPEFIKLHLSNQQKKKKNSEVLLGLSHSTDLLYIHSTAANPNAEEDDLSKKEVVFRTLTTVTNVPEKNCISLLNSCDGLLCIFGFEYVHICNPSTGQFRTLPQSTPRTFYVDPHGEFYELYPIIGLGRDEVAGVYKVVRIFHGYKYTNDEQMEGEKEVRVYCEIFTISGSSNSASSSSSSSVQQQDSWRAIGEFPYQIQLLSTLTHVAGKLYMLTDPWFHPNQSEILVSFDLHHETLQLLTHPDCFEDTNRDRWGMKLFEMRGSLCLLDFQIQPYAYADIWEMSSEGNWKKKYGIDLKHIVDPNNIDRLYPPISFIWWHQQPNILKMFLDGPAGAYDYDLDKQCFKNAAYKRERAMVFHLIVYVESLISVY